MALGPKWQDRVERETANDSQAVGDEPQTSQSQLSGFMGPVDTTSQSATHK